MKKKTLLIILWILLVLLIWWGICYFLINNTELDQNQEIVDWEKTEYFLWWKWEQWKTYTLKNWKIDWIEYVYYSDGSLMWERKYDNGKILFVTWYFENWTIMEIKERHDDLMNNIVYNEDWSIKSQFLRDWECIETYENWNIKWKWINKNNHKDWTWIYYDINWEELWRCDYLDDEKWEWDCPNVSTDSDWGLQLIWTTKYVNWEIIWE